MEADLLTDTDWGVPRGWASGGVGPVVVLETELSGSRLGGGVRADALGWVGEFLPTARVEWIVVELDGVDAAGNGPDHDADRASRRRIEIAHCED